MQRPTPNQEAAVRGELQVVSAALLLSAMDTRVRAEPTSLQMLCVCEEPTSLHFTCCGTCLYWLRGADPLHFC